MDKQEFTALPTTFLMGEDPRAERRRRVLFEVVEAYIESGQPVPSRTLAAANSNDVSAATIRNTMCELEELGLLVQPHASAGRMPTVSGYRAYVELLLLSREPRRSASPRALRNLSQPEGELTAYLSETCRALSDLCGCVGLVLRPRLGQARLRAVQFLRLGSGRFIAVIIGDDGVVSDRVFRSEGDYTQKELERISNYVNNRFCGRTLTEAKAVIDGEVLAERALCDAAMRQMLEAARACLDSCIQREQVFVDGAAICLDAPGFEDIERVRQLLRAYDQKDRMARLLASCLVQAGVQIQIGGGGDDDVMGDFSGLAFVAAQFGDGSNAIGSVGVLGPVRMRYPYVIGVVEDVAREVGSALRLGTLHSN